MDLPQKPPTEETSWARWSTILSNSGLSSLASSLAEAGRPLAPVLAQLLHIADPLLDSPNSHAALRNLAEQLEGHEGEEAQ